MESLGKKVPAIGPKNARIMIVGESPGRQEVLEGRPFIGPAGRTLDQLLSSAGIDRREVFITNAVKYLPRFEKEKDEFFFHNELKPGTKTKVVARYPTNAFMQGIVELVGEIREVNPNVIVPLGNYALWALVQQEGISKYRGSILESTLVPGKKVIPSLHPAFYGYDGQPSKKLLGHWDFIRVAEQAKFPEINRPIRNFNINPTPGDIEDAIERFTDPSLPYVGVDTEWYSPDSLAFIAFGVGSSDIICISPDSMQAYRAYKAILGGPVPKVWQNAMFDASALFRLGIKVENVAHDTMLEWFLNWGSVVEENGLDVISSVLTEQPYYKDDVEFVGVDERGREYCCIDVAVMNEAHEKMQEEEFELTGTKRGYEISMTIMNRMITAAQTGILVDQKRLEEIREERLTRADELEESVGEKVGRRFNARAWQQVQPIVYDELGYGKRFTSRSTDQKVLMDIAATLYAENPKDEGVQILIDIIRIRQDRNICSRYLTPKIVDNDGRTKTNWKLNGTKNGRLSSTIPWWNGVAIQTMPEDGREVLIADPGHIFIGWDLAQAEARVVAIKAHDYDLLEAMANGTDIHVLLAAMLPFGLTYEQHQRIIKEDYLAKGKSKDEYAPRFLAKRTRHASNYIQTYAGLKDQINKDFLDTMIGVDVKTAKMLSKGFLAASPGLESWWQTVLQKVNTDRFLENGFGRRRNWYSHLSARDHDHRDAVAFEPQSTIADLTTLSIADLPDWHLVLAHMHDGGLIQVPIGRKDEAVEIVRRTMTRPIYVDGQELIVPVDVKVGPNWKNMTYV